MPLEFRSGEMEPKSIHHIVIFMGHGAVPLLILRGVLEAVSARDDMKVVAVCPPASQPFGRQLYNYLRAQTGRALDDLTGSRSGKRPAQPFPTSLNVLARRNSFSILIPTDGNINSRTFVQRVASIAQPSIALSVYCLQKFSPELLDCFDQTVNYHNGLLPAYKGLNATAWSVYRGESHTGFSFHRMTRELDAGPVLYQGSLPIGPADDVYDLGLSKARVAARCLPQVLRKLASGDPGQPQQGAAAYYSRDDYRYIQKVPDPGKLTSTDLLQRIRAFGQVRIRMDDRWHRVTRLDVLTGEGAVNSPFTFVTSDDKMMRATRFGRMPASVYRLLGRSDS